MVVRELFGVLGLKTDGASFAKADALLGGIKTTLVGLGVTLTAGAVYKGLVSLVDSTAAAARESGKAAQRVGVTRTAFEELAFAAEHSGLSAGDMEQSLRFLNRSIAEGARGGGEASVVFRKLGVDIGHGTRSADKVLGDLAERFKAMPDGPQKTAMAMRLFGRSGTDMIPMLNKGKEGIAELREEAHKLGMVFSDEDRQAAIDYTQASKQLHVTLEVLKRAIAVPLMRELAAGKRGLTEWLKANRELIRDRVVAFVKLLVQTLQSFVAVAHGAMEALIGIGKWLSAVAKESVALKGVFIALGIVAALAFAPAIAILGALLLVLEDVWGWVTGKRDKTLMGDLFGPYKDLGENFRKMFQINPDDSPLVKGLKTVAGLIKEIAGGVGTIDRGLGKVFGTTANPEGGWWHPSGTIDTSSPTRRDLFGREVPSPLYWQVGPGAAQAQVGVPPMIAAPGAGGSVTVGTLVLQGASTDSPRDFATQFAEQLQIQLGIAQPAVTR